MFRSLLGEPLAGIFVFMLFSTTILNDHFETVPTLKFLVKQSFLLKSEKIDMSHVPIYEKICHMSLTKYSFTKKPSFNLLPSRLNYSDEGSKQRDDSSVFNGKYLNDTQLQIVKDKLYKGTLDYSIMFN